MTIKISTLDCTLQTRAALNLETVSDYAELLREGTEFPPVKVVDVGGSLMLVDGYHRVQATQENGGDSIEADVLVGSYQKALEEALKANSAHGQRRTNADKRHALETAWENRAILFGGDPSSRQLAAICGVSARSSAYFIEEMKVCNLHTPSDATTGTHDHHEERNADIRQLLKAHLDRFSMPIPEKLYPAFASTEPKTIERELAKIRRSIHRKLAEGDLAFAGLSQLFFAKLDAAITELKFWSPFCVCRGCRGEGCERCSNRGFQTMAQYERNPPSLKATKN